MKAMLLAQTYQLSDNPNPLKLGELPIPIPGPNEVLLKVSVCGVCHTELDEIEGRTPPPHAACHRPPGERTCPHRRRP